LDLFGAFLSIFAHLCALLATPFLMKLAFCADRKHLIYAINPKYY
jgi:hypothetical protein